MMLPGWVIAGPSAQGLDRARWTSAELAKHLFRTPGIRVGSRRCRPSAARTTSAPLPAGLPLPPGRPRGAGQGPVRGGGAQKAAETGKLVLLSQHEAPFTMVPALCRTSGVKGHRPIVATRDREDPLSVLAVINAGRGQEPSIVAQGWEFKINQSSEAARHTLMGTNDHDKLHEIGWEPARSLDEWSGRSRPLHSSREHP
jgi:hypothetical protein